ncbi:hypothetical protein DXG03_000344 [Asterophora parasitica]|uniref:Uncharacterized protein n=1 Tax=Asterophora parasitica TaxID=117018 RepID=A0A9P7GGR1_9AGAR|nr:hypothetical protein DXG03_000344 [Asterophora parasitica]
MDDLKIPLPKFLKLLTSNNVSMPKAMALSAKIYKTYNTPAKLAQLDDIKLVSAGVDNKDDRKIFLAALREAGHLPKDARKKLVKAEASSIAGPSSSTLNAVQAATTPHKRKRKRTEDVNDLLPKGPVDEAATYGSLEFGEILDEEILKIKSTVINRAPLMTGWAMIVAERLGFRREEALSIATAYTEMNAVTKGVSLGIYKNGKEQGMEAVKGGSQSYIEFIGRRYVIPSTYMHVSTPMLKPSPSALTATIRIPLYQTQDGQWRALSNGTPVKPSVAFSYISRAFRHTTPHIIGALRLLANSYAVEEVNRRAWSLYAEFRPEVEQWGGRSEVKCSTILDLRKKDAGPTHAANANAESIIKHEEVVAEVSKHADSLAEAPELKKMKLELSVEEYEASLDQDFVYDDVDLNLDKSYLTNG